MSLLMTLVVGALVGWIASMLMKTNAQMGAIANIAVGIVGAWLGTWLAGLLGFLAMSSIAGLITSIIGACTLIAVLKALNIFK